MNCGSFRIVRCILKCVVFDLNIGVVNWIMEKGA